MAEPPVPSGGEDKFGFLARKIGPIPVWAWGAIAVGIYYWYTHYGPGASKAASAAGTGTGTDTSGDAVTETLNTTTGPTSTNVTYTPDTQDMHIPPSKTVSTQPRAVQSAKSAPPQSEPIFNATYTVQKGQTLQEVANQFHISREQLAHANGFGTGAGLRTGEKLKVPSPAPGGKPNKAP